jgi:hypothetical protein
MSGGDARGPVDDRGPPDPGPPPSVSCVRDHHRFRDGRDATGRSEGRHSRLFACKRFCTTPKSPRSVATFCLSFYYHNNTGLQFLGEGPPPNSRVPSLQAPAGLRQKTFRRPKDFSTNPVGPGPGRRGRAGREGSDGGAGRAGIGPPGGDPAGGSRARVRSSPVASGSSGSLATLTLFRDESRLVFFLAMSPGIRRGGLSPGSVVPFVRGLHFAPGWSSWVVSMVRSSSPAYS